MGLDKAGRLAQLGASRGPLEHELYAAEIELAVKEAGVEHGVTGVSQEEVEAAKAQVEGKAAQLKVIDDLKEQVDLEQDDEA